MRDHDGEFVVGSGGSGFRINNKCLNCNRLDESLYDTWPVWTGERVFNADMPGLVGRTLIEPATPQEEPPVAPLAPTERVTWSTTHRGAGIQIDGLEARNSSGRGESLRSAAPLPATGRHFVQVRYHRYTLAHGESLMSCYWTGVMSAEAAAAHDRRTFDVRNGLARVHGFWGVDDSGGAGEGSGIRLGRASHAEVPPIAKGERNRVFRNNDVVGLLVDMDARTLTMFVNGRLIPGLVLGGLPDLVYICATPFNDDASATILPSASLPDMTDAPAQEVLMPPELAPQAPAPFPDMTGTTAHDAPPETPMRPPPLVRSGPHLQGAPIDGSPRHEQSEFVRAILLRLGEMGFDETRVRNAMATADDIYAAVNALLEE